MGKIRNVTMLWCTVNLVSTLRIQFNFLFAINIQYCVNTRSFPSLSISVIDCVLSDWGQWSECDAKCGTGIMSRQRTILRAPENGGKHCGSLAQKRGCQGYRCSSAHDRKALKGIGSAMVVINGKTCCCLDFPQFILLNLQHHIFSPFP